MTQNLTEGNFNSGLNRQQLIENRSAMNQRQSVLFNKSGGAYTCPITYANSTQNNIMNKVCHSSVNANNINNSTQKGGKKKLKRKTKKRKIKKKSKRRK
jgi:hypothetical protein